MPWTSDDAKQARRWAEIANAVLRRTGDEAQAIRVASAKVRK